ncbi:MAG: OsmC family protein [Thermoplasmata archaeon]|nr:OsmC family protein [Thermoplasmata archaeon]
MEEYRTELEWEGDRIGTLTTGSGIPIKFSSPSKYKGVDNRASPEELLIAAESACYLLTFAALAEKMRFEFLSYSCGAVGVLEKTDEGTAVTKITLRPKIVVKSEEDAEKTEKALEISMRHCFIGNSIKSEIVLEPEIIVSDE